MTDELKNKTSDFIDEFKATAAQDDVLFILASEPGGTLAVGLGEPQNIVETLALEMLNTPGLHEVVCAAVALHDHLEECPKCREHYAERR